MINSATDQVLITGAAGAIGTALRNGLRSEWRHLRLTDTKPIADPTPNEECIVADISDRSAVERMMEGVAAVVHLAGVGGTTRWRTCSASTRAACSTCSRQRAWPACSVSSYASSQPRVRLLSDPEARLPCPAAAPRQPVRHVQGVGRDDAALLLRPPRHTFCLAAHRHVSDAADRPALARHLAVARRRRAPGGCALRHPDPGCLVVNGYSTNTRIQDVSIRTGSSSATDRRTTPRTTCRCCANWASMWTAHGNGPRHGGSHARAPERPTGR